MKILLLVIGVFIAVRIVALFVFRRLSGQAQDAMAEKYEVREKEHTWEDLGISDEMQKESELAEKDGYALVDPPPGFTERVMEKIRIYENSLRKLCELKKDDVIRMGNMQHAFDHMFDGAPTKYHLFVIEAIKMDDIFVAAVARQLHDDETYNPRGQTVLLMGTTKENKKVELVGQMNYDRTAMTHTLPRK